MKRKVGTEKTAETDNIVAVEPVADVATDAMAGVEIGTATDASEEGVAPDTANGAAADDDGATTDAGGNREDVLTPERVADMVAEAEQRGYLRGRNESIEVLMRKPGMFERVADGRVDEAGGEQDVPEFLGHRRVSIWER